MRDKKNLSHPETPVFMRVVRDYVRDEGFFFVLQQFLDFCFEVFDLGGTLYQVVATINQEEVGHGLNVVKHQAL